MTASKAPSSHSTAPTPVGATPGGSEEFARINGRLTVHDYLPSPNHGGASGAGKCEWSAHVASGLTPDEIGGLAWVLIDEIMKSRFGPARRLYEEWRKHTLAGTKIQPPLDRAIGAFVQAGFGLPGAPGNKDHLHAHVGEWLWHLLTKSDSAVRVQPDPKSDVTDGGADGFTVYESGNGELRLRLWEMKKNTGSGSLSTSLNEAYTQIADSGQRYIAKIVSTFTQASTHPSGEMLEFISRTPAAWVQGDEIVGAGVSLATHKSLPNAPFRNMSSKLPLLNKSGQLRGIVISVSSYDELAITARRYAWTAL